MEGTTTQTAPEGNTVTVYTATPDLCHSERSWSQSKLPMDWSGKKFRFREGQDTVFLASEEGETSEYSKTWHISPELAAAIRERGPASEEQQGEASSAVKEPIEITWNRDAQQATEPTEQSPPENFDQLSRDELIERITYSRSINRKLSTEITRLNEKVQATESLMQETSSNFYRQVRVHEEFKREVAKVAHKYAREHDWCGVVNEALEEMGIEPYHPRYSMEVVVTYRVEGYPQHEDPDDAWVVRDKINTGDLDLEIDEWEDVEVEVSDTEVRYVEAMDVE